MDSLTSWILTNLSFFASGLGILVIGLSALLTILLWEWRVMLLGLTVVQIGVVVLTTAVYQFPLEWGTVQLLVTALGAAMLALSAQQVQPVLRMQRPGSWPVRLSAVILLVVSWQFVDLELALPLLTPQVAQLFFWLFLCAVMLLGLSGSPFYTGVALLFWFIPIQAFLQILLPDHRLFVLIGIVEIFVTLACSYLLLAHRLPLATQSASLTDVTFPEERLLPVLPGEDWAPRLANDKRWREPVANSHSAFSPMATGKRTSISPNGPALPNPVKRLRPSTGEQIPGEPTLGEQGSGKQATGEDKSVRKPM